MQRPEWPWDRQDSHGSRVLPNNQPPGRPIRSRHKRSDNDPWWDEPYGLSPEGEELVTQGVPESWLLAHGDEEYVVSNREAYESYKYKLLAYARQQELELAGERIERWRAAQ